MTKKFDRVRAGDLITDIFLNNLLIYLEDLDKRVTALEQGSGSVAITSLPFGSLRVGQEIHLKGRNFGFSTGQQKVFFDDIPVSEFKIGSDDTELIFVIPNIPNITDTEKVVVLTVANQGSTDSRIISVLSALHGVVLVSYEGVDTPAPPQPIQTGKPAIFKFIITAHSESAIFSLTASFLNKPEWNSLLLLLNEQENVITAGQYQVNSEQTRTFYVQIAAIPSDAPTDTAINLSVGAVAGSVTGGTIASFTPGQPADKPDDHTKLSFDNATFAPLAVGNGDFEKATNTIRMKVGVTATAVVTATFALSGTYNLSLPASMQSWTATFSDKAIPDNNFTVTILDSEVANNKPAVRSINIAFTPAAGASSLILMALNVQHANAPAPNSRTLTFVLKLLS